MDNDNGFGAFLRRFQRSSWTRADLEGGYPKLIQKASLPTASADYRNAFIVVDGAAGAADVVYCCLKSALDAYSWVAVATG